MGLERQIGIGPIELSYQIVLDVGVLHEGHTFFLFLSASLGGVDAEDFLCLPFLDMSKRFFLELKARNPVKFLL